MSAARVPSRDGMAAMSEVRFGSPDTVMGSKLPSPATEMSPAVGSTSHTDAERSKASPVGAPGSRIRMSGAPSIMRPFQTAPSASMPAIDCESLEMAMSTNGVRPVPASPATGRTPSGTSLTTPSGRAT